MNCAIVGINWGDEGKGRMVDLIAADYDVVVRYQGGNNAGHTIIVDGVLPRKTFSMGHAQDKRYYIEARKIVE